jgi:Protein of unknown function (DUF3592)
MTSVLRFLGALLLLLGAGIFCYGVRLLVIAHSSESWPSVQGRVLSSSLAAHSGSKGSTAYHADVFYEFAVDGARCTSNDINCDKGSHSDPLDAQCIVSRYPAGQVVTVHYSPNDPNTSVLEPGITTKAMTLPGIAVLGFSVGLWAFLSISGPRRR